LSTTTKNVSPLERIWQVVATPLAVVSTLLALRLLIAALLNLLAVWQAIRASFINYKENWIATAIAVTGILVFFSAIIFANSPDQNSLMIAIALIGASITASGFSWFAVLLARQRTYWAKLLLVRGFASGAILIVGGASLGQNSSFQSLGRNIGIAGLWVFVASSLVLIGWVALLGLLYAVRFIYQDVQKAMQNDE
jgi:hypothetical protein